MQVCKPKGCLPSELSGVLCLAAALTLGCLCFSSLVTVLSAVSVLMTYIGKTAAHTNYLASARLADPGGPGTKQDSCPECSAESFTLYLIKENVPERRPRIDGSGVGRLIRTGFSKSNSACLELFVMIVRVETILGRHLAV